MKKNDIILVLALIILLMAWPYIDRHLLSRFFPEPPEPAVAEETLDAETEVLPAEEMDVDEREPVFIDEVVEDRDDPEIADEDSVELPAAIHTMLENSELRLTLSTHGGSVVKAELKNYPLTEEDDSESVYMDFEGHPSLSYQDLPGLCSGSNFELIESSASSVIFRATSPHGLVLEREYSLSDDGYLLMLNDTWTVEGENPLQIEGAKIQLGWMESLPNISELRGMMFLGIDSLSSGGRGVTHWGRRIDRFFKDAAEEAGTRSLPMSIATDPWEGEHSMDWIAVKNKYFTQILTPGTMAKRGEIRAVRKPTRSESAASDIRDGRVELERVGAALVMEEQIISPSESVEWGYSCYIGPKKLSALRELADHKVDVMQLGWLGSIGKILLTMLNGIYSVIPNYGLAIIILTFIIKFIFWPITHKGMQGMRRMQEMQPEMNAIKEKYKDDRQRQQQEMARLWKEHKINPIGGCLPMIVQIPVFIALFTVLRSAIELRFAQFLWISDLSEPEQLFSLGFSLPFLGEYFNLLPILMAVTMWLQQKMTPSGGDAQQQKMMAIVMPIMIFVMLYNFPSGLILYWTTNQIATIVGQTISKRRRSVQKANA